MAVITYTAKRNVAPGREADEEYSFEVPLADWTPDSSPEANGSMSLSGRQFTTLYRVEKGWSVGILPIHVLGDDAALARQIEEWADSVAAGEPFYIDPFGTVDVPVEPIQVQLPARRSSVSQNMTNSVGYYSYSFQVRRFI